MKSIYFSKVVKFVFSGVFLCFSVSISAQDGDKYSGDFWSRVQYGGGLGLSIGSDYTDITIAPSAIYNFNQYFAAGIGLTGSYVKVKNFYSSYIYGGSIIGIFTPFQQLQLSTELEQVRVNNEFDLGMNPNVQNNFWNTALYLGAGYNTGNVTIGVRYNVLFDKEKYVYSEAFMPFVRVYF